jgi:hypothetical protein
VYRHDNTICGYKKEIKCFVFQVVRLNHLFHYFLLVAEGTLFLVTIGYRRTIALKYLRKIFHSHDISPVQKFNKDIENIFLVDITISLSYLQDIVFY